jgi:hypothetical protein
VEKGIPALLKNGFQRSPFSSAAHGRNHLKDFSYQMCRLNNESELEMIDVYICRRDKWIKINLNIFQVSPELTSLDQLKGLVGLQYRLPPNSISEMRLRQDDIKGIFLFAFFFGRQHKVRSYQTRWGFRLRIALLGRLLERDMTGIDRFIRRWHDLHKSLVVDWEGHPQSIRAL